MADDRHLEKSKNVQIWPVVRERYKIELRISISFMLELEYESKVIIKNYY